MFAYDFPLLGVFWSMFIIFIWVLWFFLLFRVFVDIFRSDDLGGFAKVLWLIFVILVPFLGVFVYIIARGRSMNERDLARARQNEAEFQSYVQTVAADAPSTADELTKLADLKASGVLTDAEYEQQKAKLLS
jgi:hypothetical protein